jgi:hypothetical protein
MRAKLEDDFDLSISKAEGESLKDGCTLQTRASSKTREIPILQNVLVTLGLVHSDDLRIFKRILKITEEKYVQPYFPFGERLEDFPFDFGNDILSVCENRRQIFLIQDIMK